MQLIYKCCQCKYKIFFVYHDKWYRNFVLCFCVTLGSFVTTSWEKYKPVFTNMRDKDPFLGEYFQWLAERIDERMKQNPRKPFYKPGAIKNVNINK